MAAPHPEHAHATDRPAIETFPTRPTHMTIGRRQDRRPVVSKQPLHSIAAAKMSPHIRIGPEPVLSVHALSPPASGSHCLAGSDSAPHSEQNFCFEGKGQKKVSFSGPRAPARTSRAALGGVAAVKLAVITPPSAASSLLCGSLCMAFDSHNDVGRLWCLLSGWCVFDSWDDVVRLWCLSAGDLASFTPSRLLHVYVMKHAERMPRDWLLAGETVPARAV